MEKVFIVHDIVHGNTVGVFRTKEVFSAWLKELNVKEDGDEFYEEMNEEDYVFEDVELF